MTPALQSALAQPRVLLAGFLRIQFPDYTLRLVDGGTVQWGAETFVSRDDRFGTIGAMSAIAEEVGDTAPAVDVSLIPPSLADAIELANAAMQGAPARIWMGAIDREAGTVISEPELIFAGEVDTVALELARGERSVEITIVSVFERLFDDDEGARLSDTFHQSIWPGELGFVHMTSTVINEIWGPGDRPPAAVQIAQFPRTGVQRFF